MIKELAILLFGQNTNPKYDLRKQETTPSNSIFSGIMMWIENWILNHATLCLIIAFALLIALFTVLIFALIGVSAVDSGVTYNHMQDVI